MKTSQRAVIFVVIAVFIVSVLGSAIFILAEDSMPIDQHGTDVDVAESTIDPNQRELAIQDCNFAQSPDPIENPPEVPDFDIPNSIDSLQFNDLTVGEGATAEEGDCIVAYYSGVLTDGTEFDGNYGSTVPAKFSLYGVIEGWSQGLQGMKEGGTRVLSIPADLAYGDQERGSIPANSDLVFVVELVEIVEI